MTSAIGRPKKKETLASLEVLTMQVAADKCVDIVNRRIEDVALRREIRRQLILIRLCGVKAQEILQ